MNRLRLEQREWKWREMLGCILEVKLMGLSDKLNVGSKDQREVREDCWIFGWNSDVNDCFSEGGWMD